MTITRKEFMQNTGKAIAGWSILNVGIVPRAKYLKSKNSKGEAMIEYKIKQLKLTHTWTISRSSADVKNNVFVKYARNGVFGIGEAAPNVRYHETPESTIAVIQKAIPVFEKFDPWHFVDMGYAFRELAVEQTAAKCALDIAIMDWVSKMLAVPLYKYYGLNKAKAPITTFSIGIDKPEVMQQKIREAGEYPILKIKVGTAND